MNTYTNINEARIWAASACNDRGITAVQRAAFDFARDNQTRFAEWSRDGANQINHVINSVRHTDYNKMPLFA